MNIGYGDLSLQDWREIRSGDYWEIRDSLSAEYFYQTSSPREIFIWERIELWRANNLKKR